MPQAIPVPVRQAIVERHQHGQPLSRIAQALGLSLWTVRSLWRRYRRQGADGLTPAYARCGRLGPQGSRRVYRAAVWLRRHHPGWGAGLIRVLLAQRWPKETIAHERTLQRWFRQAGLAPTRRRAPAQNATRARAVHAVWQMDAKEQVPLADGSQACWLSVTDEASGGVLAARVFPPEPLDERDAVGGADGVAGGLRPVGLARPPSRG